MKRVVVVGLVLFGMLMVSSSEAIAASKIAFRQNGSIWIMNQDGSNPSFLVADGYTFSWSPDGSQIVYTLWNESCVCEQLYVKNSDGTGVPVLLRSSSATPVWSPELPPSVASLSPFNQTITVFLLGMIASALIMRGKAATEAS